MCCSQDGVNPCKHGCLDSFSSPELEESSSSFIFDRIKATRVQKPGEHRLSPSPHSKALLEKVAERGRVGVLAQG